MSELSKKSDPQKNIPTSENESAGCFEILFTVLSCLLLIITFPLSIWICIRVLNEFERGVVFRFGKLRKGGARGPGTIFILPCIDQYIKLDLRTVTFDLEPQEILTKDSVAIKVDAVVYYRLYDPLSAVIQVANYRHSTMLLGQTTLRNVAATKHLNDLMAQREEVTHSMQQILDEATSSWGVKVERVEIKDVRLPIALQRAMATEAEAVREAKAKIVAATGEKSAALALSEAANKMSENPTSLQLRYLQTLGSISSEKNCTIIFPFPMEMLGGLQ